MILLQANLQSKAEHANVEHQNAVKKIKETIHETEERLKKEKVWFTWYIIILIIIFFYSKYLRSFVVLNSNIHLVADQYWSKIVI